jgi:hypothetical protein
MDAGVEVELVRHRGGEAPAVPAELGQRLAGAPRFLAALYQFSRPHTMLGTFVSIVSVSALAVVRAPGGAPVSPVRAGSLSRAAVACWSALPSRPGCCTGSRCRA